MADLTITVANVVKNSTGYEDAGTFIAGETITQGMPVYLDSSSVAYKCDANVASGAKANCIGVAMNSALAGQPVTVGKGQIAFGSIITTAKVYVVSETAGGIKPIDDQASGDYLCELGVGLSSTVMEVRPKYWGVAKA